VKRLLAGVSLVAFTTTAALAATEAKPAAKPAPPAHTKPAPARVAPADEYFGKLKMSVLGIRNTIKDVGANLDIDQARWTQLASKAAFCEDAMRDWEKKYPQDTWIPHALFTLERVYAKVDSDEARAKAKATMLWLVHDFPKSKFAATGRQELAQHLVGVKPSPAPNAPSIGGADDVSATTATTATSGTTAASAASATSNTTTAK